VVDSLEPSEFVVLSWRLDVPSWLIVVDSSSLDPSSFSTSVESVLLVLPSPSTVTV